MKITICILLGLTLGLFSYGQTTTTVELLVKQDAFMHGLDGYRDNVYGTYPYMRAVTWTNGGRLFSSRSLLEFDLDDIPDDAEIVSATLYLDGTNHYALTASNQSRLYLVLDSWNENAVSFNSAPAYHSSISVTIPGTVMGAKVHDDMDIDLTAMVKKWHNGVANNGMLFKLVNEVKYAEMRFYSKEGAGTKPKLEIVYKKRALNMVSWNMTRSNNIEESEYEVKKINEVDNAADYAVSRNCLVKGEEGSFEFYVSSEANNMSIGFAPENYTAASMLRYGVNVAPSGSVTNVKVMKNSSTLGTYPVILGDKVKVQLKQKGSQWYYQTYINDVLKHELSVDLQTAVFDNYIGLTLLSKKASLQSVTASFTNRLVNYIDLSNTNSQPAFVNMGVLPLKIYSDLDQERKLRYRVFDLDNINVDVVAVSYTGSTLSRTPSDAPLTTISKGDNLVVLNLSAYLQANKKYGMEIYLDDKVSHTVYFYNYER